MRRLAVSLVILGMIFLVVAVGCEKAKGPNQPPSKPTITASATTVKSGGTVNLTASSTDIEGDTLTYTWSVSPDEGSFSSTTGSSTTWTAPSISGDKSYTISVKVSDGKGGENSSSITILVASSKIVFMSNRDGNYEIYIMDATGANQTRLTNNSARDGEPTISPDGTKIAFDSDRDGTLSDIYVMNVDGTSVTRLTDVPGTSEQPAWSPDGTKIAFMSERDGEPEIYVMNADGSNQTRLTINLDDWDILPSWSPDGSEIAFTRLHPPKRADIYKMKSDGTDVVNLTNNPTKFNFTPAWSPDGSKITFESHRDGDWEIYYLDVSNPTLQYNLTNQPGSEEWGATWSPEGSRIAFCSYRDGNSEIYSMKADGSDQTRLTDNSAEDNEPDW
jgi:Tol biopolymer transport system component